MRATRRILCSCTLPSMSLYHLYPSYPSVSTIALICFSVILAISLLSTCFVLRLPWLLALLSFRFRNIIPYLFSTT
ncbi:hypothetical protein OF83DRAFT_780735 [Amylostereum chailletii]|nr:hypothetical protein OF83DRAFT_780735 [Amylostereum chailletii]